MRHLIYHLLMTAVILTAMSSPTLGQMIGQRLRVETSGGSKVTGTVSTRNPDSFILNVEGGGRKTISFATVKKMEKYMGEGTHKKRGFIIGMGFGSLSTALVFGFAFNALCSAGEMLAAGDPGCGGFAAGSALLGAIGGAVIPGIVPLGLIGSVVGAGMETEKWEPIKSPPSGRTKSHLGIRPMLQLSSKGDRRALVGARIHF